MVIAWLTACALVPPAGCTEIGCVDGVSVEITGLPAGPTVVVLLDGQREIARRTWDDGTGSCAAFAPEMPDLVTVQVTTAGNTTTDQVTPSYRSEQPNGRGCPPICLIARVSIPLP